MPYSVMLEDIFSIRADIAVLGVENPMIPSQGKIFEQLAELGGEKLSRELRRLRFLSVGRAATVDSAGLPFQHLIAVASPRWQNGEANELSLLRRCYTSIYNLAETLGGCSITMPFLSTNYYRFPAREALRIAISEASSREIETIFLANDVKQLELCHYAGQKPCIVSYIGYYRDHAVFALDNGMFAYVDLRPELEKVSIRAYYDSCYLACTDPRRLPLSDKEIDRLQKIYEKATF